MDTTDISRGSLQEKKPKYHSLPILLKLLAFSWAGQKVVWGEGEFCLILWFLLGFLVSHTVKCPPTTQETGVQSLGREDPLEKEVATHCSTLAWRIPWTEDLVGLQSMGSQRVRHN